MWKVRLAQGIVALIGIAGSAWFVFFTPQYMRTNAYTCPGGQASCTQGLTLAPFPVLILLFVLLLVLVAFIVWAIGSFAKFREKP